MLRISMLEEPSRAGQECSLAHDSWRAGSAAYSYCRLHALWWSAHEGEPLWQTGSGSVEIGDELDPERGWL